MKKIGLLAGGCIVVFILALAVYSGCGGGGGGSKNQASSSLDSLPNATLDQSSTSGAAKSASSAASSASEVPKSSDYKSTTGVSPFFLKALSKALSKSSLPIEQKAIISHAFNSLNPQTVYPGCPQITDNSSGTTVDVTVEGGAGGAGCTVTTGTTLSGSFSLKGTVDDAAGSVNVTFSFNNYKETVACTGGSSEFTASGGGTVVGSGLTSTSTAFTVSVNLNVNIGISVNCGQGSGSLSGFFVVVSSLSGTRSGNTWTFSGSEATGLKFANVGEYSEWSGTVVVDTTAKTATINLTGRIGWEFGNDKGKVSFKLTDVVVDDSVCFYEPKSGTLEITGNNSAVLTFDGQTNQCGCCPWSLNGIQQTIICW